MYLLDWRSLIFFFLHGPTFGASYRACLDTNPRGHHRKIPNKNPTGSVGISDVWINLRLKCGVLYCTVINQPPRKLSVVFVCVYVYDGGTIIYRHCIFFLWNTYFVVRSRAFDNGMWYILFFFLNFFLEISRRRDQLRSTKNIARHFTRPPYTTSPAGIAPQRVTAQSSFIFPII